MEWNNQPSLDPSLTPSQVLADVSAQSFMSRVFMWMTAGLGVTAATAVFTASTPAVFSAAMTWSLPLILLQLGLVLVLSGLAPRLSAAVAGALFLVYSALTGLTLSWIFYRYHLGSVATAFAISGGTFGALSLYGTVTKKDLSAWGTFLFMGLVGILIAGVVNIFVRSEAISFVSSCAGVLVFAGLTAYDTQKLRQYHAAMGASGAVRGALVLYLDFLNLFLSILRLMGRRR